MKKNTRKLKKRGGGFSMPKISVPKFSIPGSRTLANLSRKSDQYGDLHFISFYCAILSRLAYTNDNYFFEYYKKIFGPVIPFELMKSIDDVANIAEILDDEKIFDLKGSNPGNLKTYTYKDKLFIDFIGQGMPQSVNEIIKEISSAKVYEPGVGGKVKYISLGWSNYGEIYILADKRMPHSIFVIFRGTYSAGTTAIYSKPTSAIPLQVCIDSNGKPESYLYGVFKVTVEMIHTIIESMRYLVVNFLNASEPDSVKPDSVKPDSVKVITTEHSLGGAMCTDFAYLWVNSITKTPPYNNAPYDIFKKEIICISLGSPRVFNTNISEKFCDHVKNNTIVYLRIVTRGDPVPSLPPSVAYFAHPCADPESLKDGMEQKVWEDCNANLTMRPRPGVKYDWVLDCQNYKTRLFVTNMLSHTIYLDILFIGAIDIKNFAKGIVLEKEVKRVPKTKETVCRIILMDGSDENAPDGKYYVIFFDVNASRLKATNIDAAESEALDALGKTLGDDKALQEKDIEQTEHANQDSDQGPVQSGGIGGAVAEDVRVSKEIFDQMLSLSPENIYFYEIDGPDKFPMVFTEGKLFKDFSGEVMPSLQCGPSVKSGGRKKNTIKYRKKSNKTKKRKRNK
jgi:hypothetical protein